MYFFELTSTANCSVITVLICETKLLQPLSFAYVIFKSNPFFFCSERIGWNLGKGSSSLAIR